jgi:murein DD-endopeptidase MepM/ murein hydrolase activator NlpD
MIQNKKIFSKISQMARDFREEKFAPILKLKRKFRSGNLVSRILREVFEKRSIRSIVGAQLLAGMVLFGPLSGLNTSHPTELAYPGIGVTDVVIEVSNDPQIETTSVLMQNPTAGFKGVSTKFQRGHAGIDLRAYLGSDVFPLTSGVVEKIVHSVSGYGRRVIVKHDDGFESLYAHMGLISVEEGETVTEETKLGEVGMTGFTTGPHIHLELYKDGVPVNPMYYIDLNNLPTSQ